MIMYRGYFIEYDPAPISERGADYRYWHEDYDGPEDLRIGSAESIDAAKALIDDRVDESDCLTGETEVGYVEFKNGASGGVFSSAEKANLLELEELLELVHVGGQIHDLDQYSKEQFGVNGSVLFDLMQRYEIMDTAIRKIAKMDATHIECRTDGAYMKYDDIAEIRAVIGKAVDELGLVRTTE